MELQTASIFESLLLAIDCKMKSITFNGKYPKPTDPDLQKLLYSVLNGTVELKVIQERIEKFETMVQKFLVSSAIHIIIKTYLNASSLPN